MKWLFWFMVFVAFVIFKGCVVHDGSEQVCQNYETHARAVADLAWNEIIVCEYGYKNQ